MLISLMRHGATANNEARVLEGHSSTPLSKIGRRQSKLAAAYLGKRNVTAIFASTAPRAIETAAILSTELKVPYSSTPSLNERNYGPFDGLTRHDLLERRAELHLSNLDPTQDWDEVTEVESDGAVWTRVKPVIDLARESHHQGHVLLVTHNGVIKATLYRLFMLPPTRARCFCISNGCVFTLREVGSCLELFDLWQSPLQY